MRQVNIHEAKTHLSRLLEEVEAGEELVIARNGRPVARIVPFGGTGTRTPGAWRGKVQIPDDFDALPSDLLAAFEGGEE